MLQHLARSSMNVSRVFWRLLTMCHAVVTQNGGDAQAIAFEDALAAGGLNSTMCFQVAPRLHGLFVFPERQRQQFSRLAQALEALDGNKPRRLLQLAAQSGGSI